MQPLGSSLPLGRLHCWGGEGTRLVPGLTMAAFRHEEFCAVAVRSLSSHSEPPASCISIPENGTLSSHFGSLEI